MLELSLEEAMELKIGRRLPSWRPAFMFKVCSQGKMKGKKCKDIGAVPVSRCEDKGPGVTPELSGSAWVTQMFRSFSVFLKLWIRPGLLTRTAFLPDFRLSLSLLGKLPKRQLAWPHRLQSGRKKLFHIYLKTD